MKRVFVFQDFKSQKFWSIDVRGTDVIVNYGKLGTDGQTQVKNFSSAGEAEKAAGKLIAEKTKKHEQNTKRVAPHAGARQWGMRFPRTLRHSKNNKQIVKEYENSKINAYSVSTVFLINRIGRDFLFVRHETAGRNDGRRTGIRHHNARADFD